MYASARNSALPKNMMIAVNGMS